MAWEPRQHAVQCFKQKGVRISNTILPYNLDKALRTTGC
jgi:hypothetical protein